jgi:hypothetical protein
VAVPDLPGRSRCLAATYSHMEKLHTTIGAEPFHFRVRDGIGWFRAAHPIIPKNAAEGAQNGLVVSKSGTNILFQYVCVCVCVCSKETADGKRCKLASINTVLIEVTNVNLYCCVISTCD